MIRHISTALFCLLLGTRVVLADAVSDFDQANRLYASGKHADAAAAYERILAEAGPRAPLYYNLGNAFQNLGDYGHAILAYERALLLSPRDPDLLANLAKARKAAAAFEEPPAHPAFDVVMKYLSRDEWSWLVAGCALFLGILSVWRGFARKDSGAGDRAVRISVGIAVCLIMAGSGVLYQRRDEDRRGVVLSGNAAVRLSPFDEAESLGTPGAGRIVRLREKNGGFQYVEVPGTHLSGWMALQQVEPVIPDASSPAQ